MKEKEKIKEKVLEELGDKFSSFSGDLTLCSCGHSIKKHVVYRDNDNLTKIGCLGGACNCSNQLNILIDLTIQEISKQVFDDIEEFIKRQYDFTQEDIKRFEKLKKKWCK